MASESKEQFTLVFPAQLSTVLRKHFAKHQWGFLVLKKKNLPIATIWANHFRKTLRRVNAGKTPALHPIPSSPKRDFLEHLKSSPMFNVSGSFPGLKIRSQTNLFLFFLFFPRCLLAVRVEDRLRGQTDPQSEPAQPFLHSHIAICFPYYPVTGSAESICSFFLLAVWSLLFR